MIELFKEKHQYSPNETELSLETGLSRGTIRRCKLIIELPERFKDMLLEELNKPKSKQVLSEDFFLEMEGALKTVRRNFPDIVENIDEVRDNLIKKFRNNVIDNMLDFRMIRKIAVAHKNVEYPVNEAKNALKQVFEDNEMSIEKIFKETVGDLYDEKRFISNANNLLYHLERLDDEEKQDTDIRETLRNIKRTIEQILNEEE